jgi:hypothetical protein
MKAKMILRRSLICLLVLCPISAWGGSTVVWPAGSWLVPPGWSAPDDNFPLSYGKAYFTPVLLPANSSVTKLGIVQAGPGQQCRAIDPALPLQLERKRDAGNPSERWGRNGNRWPRPQ